MGRGYLRLLQIGHLFRVCRTGFYNIKILQRYRITVEYIGNYNVEPGFSVDVGENMVIYELNAVD